MSHGGDVAAAARAWGCERADILDLSTGVVPEPWPERMADLLHRLAPTAGWYPDPDGEPARSVLADTLDVPRPTLLMGAGAQAFIDVIFSAMHWNTIALQRPEYGEVEPRATRAGVDVRSSRLGEAWPDADAAWVTSPHGFTGEARTRPSTRAGVLDESYASLDTRKRTGVIPSWIRIGSLTKSFSIPGLRVGYAIAEPALLDRLRAHLPPWPAPTLGLHAMSELAPSWSDRDRRAATDRRRLARLLERHGWATFGSHASFVLARSARHPDFTKHRILVRTFPSSTGLGECVRFGLPGTEGDWHRLQTALGEGDASARGALP